MQNEIKDNEKFTENDELPVLDTPHFDDEEIAQARPVQPLARISQSGTALMPRMVSLIAMIATGLFVTAALAIGFVNSNSPLRSASGDGAAPSEIATKAESASDQSKDLGEKNQTPTYQRRKSSFRRFERPRLLIRFGDGDERRPKARLVLVIQ